MNAIIVALVALVAVAVALAGASVRVLREYERAVVFRLGRLVARRGPGLVLLIPGVDRMVRVSLRTVTLTIPPQEVITRDNVPARVTAVAYFRVVNPDDAVVQVESYERATSQIAQTTLRSVLGKADLDTLLAERERLNDNLQQIIDEQTEPWGVKVTTVEIKDVEIPSAMQRAMARQAEAERERRAKIINAEGEYQASERLFDAAQIISRNPAALQLRYLQTLGEIGVQQNSTVVFPLPMDLVAPLIDAARAMAASGNVAADGPSPGDQRSARSVASATDHPELDHAAGRRSLGEEESDPTARQLRPGDESGAGARERDEALARARDPNARASRGSSLASRR